LVFLELLVVVKGCGDEGGEEFRLNGITEFLHPDLLGGVVLKISPPEIQSFLISNLVLNLKFDRPAWGSSLCHALLFFVSVVPYLVILVISGLFRFTIIFNVNFLIFCLLEGHLRINFIKSEWIQSFVRNCVFLASTSH